jgi:hypothetical protein
MRSPAKTPTRKTSRKTRPAKDRKLVFLNELVHTGNVSAAARKARIHRDTAYAFRQLADGPTPNPEAAAFAKAWDAALKEAIDALELEARRRAVEGVLEPAGWYKGKAGGKVRRYSDTLLVVLLKAHRPAKYRENVKMEHAGEITLLTREQIEQTRRRALGLLVLSTHSA